MTNCRQTLVAERQIQGISVGSENVKKEKNYFNEKMQTVSILKTEQAKLILCTKVIFKMKLSSLTQKIKLSTKVLLVFRGKNHWTKSSIYGLWWGVIAMFEEGFDQFCVGFTSR